MIWKIAGIIVICLVIFLVLAANDNRRKKKQVGYAIPQVKKKICNHLRFKTKDKRKRIYQCRGCGLIRKVIFSV